jgi:hypothetical protein
MRLSFSCVMYDLLFGKKPIIQILAVPLCREIHKAHMR